MKPRPPVRAYIALGSNLGERAANIAGAIDRLSREPGGAIVHVSSLLENPAVGGPSDSPPFFNAAAAIDTTLSPLELLDCLLRVEQSMGRIREQKWGPRLIDLDLILYGPGEVINTPRLHVPHPLMHERRFVLQPLAEIAPDVVHPTFQVTVSELLSKLSE